MDNQKPTGVGKLITFLIVFGIVITLVVFAASGNTLTNLPENDDKNETNNENINNNNQNNEEENKQEESIDTPLPPNDTTPPPAPIYYNKLTGLVITEDELSSTAFGNVIDPTQQTYGLSYADIAIEFPTEVSNTRMLFFSSSKDIIWKIGNLAPTRKYINTFSSYLGGLIISYGQDDRVNYNTPVTSTPAVDISLHADCYYIENGSYKYTNEAFIDTAISRTEYANTQYGYKDAPFILSDTLLQTGIGGANNISIPYSASNKTEIKYDISTGKYLYYKNGEKRLDMLNGEAISYENVFILFSNSTTYENSNATQLVLDTTGGGKGYYFSNGLLNEFNWSIEDGKLIFKNLMGEVLNVNIGTSYISFYKASNASNITIN